MTPTVLFAFVVVSFAILVTVHVLASFTLASRAPRWNGIVALLIPPFFPYFALRRRATVWLVVWSAAALLYACALVSALRWR